MFIPLGVQLNYFDRLGSGLGCIIHEAKFMRASASESWMGAVGAGVSSTLYLLDEEALV